MMLNKTSSSAFIRVLGGGVLLFLFAQPNNNTRILVSAQCSVETRALTQCIEAEGITRATCFACVQGGLDSGGFCFGFNDRACQTISTCASCDGCKRAVENQLTCQLATTAFACPLFCSFGRDPGAPTECSSPTAARVNCFEDQGDTSWSACRECVQATLDGNSASYCGQFSDILCPAIGAECPDCQGCEKVVEEELACQFGSANSGSCPFYCGFQDVPTGPEPDPTVATPSPDAVTTQSPAPFEPAPFEPDVTIATWSPSGTPTNKSPEAITTQSPAPFESDATVATPSPSGTPTNSATVATPSPSGTPTNKSPEAITTQSPAPFEPDATVATPYPSGTPTNKSPEAAVTTQFPAGNPAPTLNTSSSKKLGCDLVHLILSSILVVFSASILPG